MKKNIITKNYLEQKPMRAEHVGWSADENEIITLEIENKGVFNTIAQKLFKRPKISYIHLDDIGSLVWPLLDGSKTIIDLGENVKEKFGEKAEPLYERLAKYFQILDSYGFIKWRQD